MTWLFIILVVLASALLGFVVLVQNPKGGGLSGSVAGFSNQFMGVKQTTDVLEKGTWLFATIIAVLCLVSSLFISEVEGSGGSGNLDKVPATQQSRPATNNTTVPAAPAQQK
ncbi:MAG: preprotein translocase subunit SecG [Lacibacter sp.]|uniref:Protein-export membrane protein SecG n=1 Tax=Lacibacter luteus TaxID=2508719 RepID=A0A4Q1CLA9_9BACT|nr:preprotein translocase subunit SecG [Lacibacter luteus]RXK61534.1 preprotein translocase subunit SecG [Lacibacter luteus]